MRRRDWLAALLGWAQGFRRGPIPSAHLVPGSRAMFNFLCLKAPQRGFSFSSLL